MDYKTLSTEDKLAAIEDVGFTRSEREVVAQYREALQTGNQAAIDDFESCGDNPHRMAMNKAHFVRALSVFGFTERVFNENGWAVGDTFMDCETLSFGCKIKSLMSNTVTIGRGPNGKWTYALWLSTSQSGRAGGLSVFAEPYTSRRDCLRRALEEVIAWHTHENDKKTTPVIREAKDMLDEITGRKPVQLTLF